MNLIKSAARQVVPALGVLCGLASAQVWNGGGTIVPAATPKYYQATDLGQVAEQFPIGCLSRGGLVAVTRHGFEPGVGAWTTRALLPYSGTPFWRPPGTSSWARACNDQMEVVGQIVGRGNVLWDGTMAQPQWLSGELQAINNRRQVVGSAPDGSGQPRAVVWHTNPQPGDPTQVWMAPGTATGINETSTVSLTLKTGYPPREQAAVGSAYSSLVLAPTLPGAVTSRGNGIGSQHHLVGGLQDASGAWRGFVYKSGEGVASLLPTWDLWGTLPHAEARAVGPDRTAVGLSTDHMDPTLRTRSAATIWVHAGGPRNLNRETSMADGSKLPRLTDAVAIGDNGTILCEGRASDGTRRAVLLTPYALGQWSRYP